jgi:hypothetical protein
MPASSRDLIGRDFPPRRPASDITYLQTGEGWLYIATVIDLATRMVVGWAAGQPYAGLADHRRPAVNYVNAATGARATFVTPRALRLHGNFRLFGRVAAAASATPSPLSAAGPRRGSPELVLRAP